VRGRDRAVGAGHRPGEGLRRTSSAASRWTPWPRRSQRRIRSTAGWSVSLLASDCGRARLPSDAYGICGWPAEKCRSSAPRRRCPAPARSSKNPRAPGAGGGCQSSMTSCCTTWVSTPPRFHDLRQPVARRRARHVLRAPVARTQLHRLHGRGVRPRRPGPGLQRRHREDPEGARAVAAVHGLLSSRRGRPRCPWSRTAGPDRSSLPGSRYGCSMDARDETPPGSAPLPPAKFAGVDQVVGNVADLGVRRHRRVRE
jgi:hypothetical protein